MLENRLHATLLELAGVPGELGGLMPPPLWRRAVATLDALLAALSRRAPRFTVFFRRVLFGVLLAELSVLAFITFLLSVLGS